MTKTGIELIADERTRQIEVEGWTPEHDAEHVTGCLAVAGASYALSMAAEVGGEHERWRDVYRDQAERVWPFDAEWRKVSSDPIRNLVKAGALIAAEIDRIQRITAKDQDND